MADRRSFIRKTAIAGGLFLLGDFPFESFASSGQIQLAILHTNDLHGRMEKFPVGSGKYEGMGGMKALGAAIKKIRDEREHVLLFDAGDFIQCSVFSEGDNGSSEIKSMCGLCYDAATLGEHDFAIGIEELALRISEANYPFVLANYDFAGSVLEGMVKPYIVLEKAGLRIGVFGLGIELDNISALHNSSIVYKTAIPVAISVSDKLKKEEQCDLVICLSHLGYEYVGEKPSDKILAMQSENIDLIIGGHTHTFLETPENILNKRKEKIIVNQAGWGGINLGLVDFNFDSKKSSKNFIAQSVILIKETIVK
jgi:5'-nucleotidase